MGMKIVGSIIAAALLILFLGPVVVKLKSVGLTAVVLIGVGMMLVDTWQSLRSADD